MTGNFVVTKSTADGDVTESMQGLAMQTVQRVREPARMLSGQDDVKARTHALEPGFPSVLRVHDEVFPRRRPLFEVGVIAGPARRP